jgi:hypothetical protein
MLGLHAVKKSTVVLSVLLSLQHLLSRRCIPKRVRAESPATQQTVYYLIGRHFLKSGISIERPSISFSLYFTSPRISLFEDSIDVVYLGSLCACRTLRVNRSRLYIPALAPCVGGLGVIYGAWVWEAKEFCCQMVTV